MWLSIRQAVLVFQPLCSDTVLSDSCQSHSHGDSDNVRFIPVPGPVGIWPWKGRVESKGSLFGTSAKKRSKIRPLCKFQPRKVSSISAVGNLGFFAVLFSYISYHCKKLNYEGAIFTQQIYSFVEIFKNEGLHSKCRFKSDGLESRSWISATDITVANFYPCWENRSRYQWDSAIAEILWFERELASPGA